MSRDDELLYFLILDSISFIIFGGFRGSANFFFLITIILFFRKEPTKTDVDVLRALDQVDVSPVGYPHVSQWKQLVLAYAEDTRKTYVI